MKLGGQLARSSVQTSAMLGLRLLTQATLLILLTRLLGPARFGDFAAVSSLAVVLGLLPPLGAGFVMLSHKARDEAAAGEVWRYAWPLSLLLGLTLGLIYMLLARSLVQPSLPMAVLLAIAGTELLTTPFCTLCSFALQADERVPLSQFVQWLPVGLRILAALPCFAFAMDGRLLVYTSLQCVAALVGALIGLAIVASQVRLLWTPRLPTRRELTMGSSYAAMNLVAVNPSELDKIIAIRAVGPHAAGIYAATARVMVSAVTPVTALLLSAQPRLFRHAHQPTRTGHRLIGLIALCALGWGLFSGLLMGACSPLLPWLFGKSFEAMAGLMPWLATVAPLLALRLCAGTVLVALGHPLERIAFELCGILVLVVAMLGLAPAWGTHGLAMALILAEACMSGLGWWLVWRRLRSGAAAL